MRGGFAEGGGRKKGKCRSNLRKHQKKSVGLVASFEETLEKGGAKKKQKKRDSTSAFAGIATSEKTGGLIQVSQKEGGKCLRKKKKGEKFRTIQNRKSNAGWKTGLHP